MLTWLSGIALAGNLVDAAVHAHSAGFEACAKLATHRDHGLQLALRVHVANGAVRDTTVRTRPGAPLVPPSTGYHHCLERLLAGVRIPASDGAYDVPLDWSGPALHPGAAAPVRAAAGPLVASADALRPALPHLRRCFEALRARHEDAGGTIVLEADVAADGAVTTAQVLDADAHDPAFHACLTQAMAAARFPTGAAGVYVVPLDLTAE